MRWVQKCNSLRFAGKSFALQYRINESSCVSPGTDGVVLTILFMWPIIDLVPVAKKEQLTTTTQ